LGQADKLFGLFGLGAAVELYLDRLAPGRSELVVDASIQLAAADTAQLSGRLTVDNMDQRILVHGRLEVHRTMECHRCGRPTEQSYPASLEVLVLRSPGRGGRLHEPQAGEEDNWVIHATRGVVDLAQAVREAVFLDEPILIRCGDDCPFEATPSVTAAAADSEPTTTTDIDPRWEKLRRLRQADDDAD
jgi:uncharacterized metal-binding protein YceD (DUF177 family)